MRPTAATMPAAVWPAVSWKRPLPLALSVRLRSLLAARGISVVTTRESDTTVDPDRRAEIANHAKAQACLSLHATESGLRHSSLLVLAAARAGHTLSGLENCAGRRG